MMTKAELDAIRAHVQSILDGHAGYGELLDAIDDIPALLAEVERLRAALAGIQEMASERLRTDDGGAHYWQIEADARAALNEDTAP